MFRKYCSFNDDEGMLWNKNTKSLLSDLYEKLNYDRNKEEERKPFNEETITDFNSLMKEID